MLTTGVGSFGNAQPWEWVLVEKWSRIGMAFGTRLGVVLGESG